MSPYHFVHKVLWDFKDQYLTILCQDLCAQNLFVAYPHNNDCITPELMCVQNYDILKTSSSYQYFYYTLLRPMCKKCFVWYPRKNDNILTGNYVHSTIAFLRPLFNTSLLVNIVKNYLHKKCFTFWRQKSWMHKWQFFKPRKAEGGHITP